MQIEFIANSSEGAHEIADAINNHTMFEACVVFRSETVDRKLVHQYSVRVLDKNALPISY